MSCLSCRVGQAIANSKTRKLEQRRAEIRGPFWQLPPFLQLLLSVSALTISSFHLNNEVTCR